MSPPRRRGLSFAFALGGAAAVAPAQSIDQLRDQVRQAAANARMSAFVAGIVDLSEMNELAAARMTIRGEPDLEVTTLKLPYQRDLSLGQDAPELHVEAGLGAFVGRADFADIWSGGLPGLETHVRTRWEGASAGVGVGPRFDLGQGVHASVLGDGSLAYLENHALYEGPGSALTASLLDGILFDWHATVVAWGGAARLEHELPFGDGLHLASLARFDLRRFAVVHSSDRAQDASDTLQRLVLRTALHGATGLTWQERSIDWEGHVAYLRFLGPNDDILGFRDYFELGGGLRAALPIGHTSALSLSAALLLGEDVLGFSVGLGIDL